MHILDNDWVALEMKYHKRCKKRYTSSVRHEIRFTSEIVYAEDVIPVAVAERALNSEEQNDLDKMADDEDEGGKEVTEAP